eukprot:3424235-Amphidinium_carterae.1
MKDHAGEQALPPVAVPLTFTRECSDAPWQVATSPSYCTISYVCQPFVFSSRLKPHRVTMWFACKYVNWGNYENGACWAGLGVAAN